MFMITPATNAECNSLTPIQSLNSKSTIKKIHERIIKLSLCYL